LEISFAEKNTYHADKLRPHKYSDKMRMSSNQFLENIQNPYNYTNQNL